MKSLVNKMYEELSTLCTEIDYIRGEAGVSSFSDICKLEYNSAEITQVLNQEVQLLAKKYNISKSINELEETFNELMKLSTMFEILKAHYDECLKETQKKEAEKFLQSDNYDFIKEELENFRQLQEGEFISQDELLSHLSGDVPDYSEYIAPDEIEHFPTDDDINILPEDQSDPNCPDECCSPEITRLPLVHLGQKME